MRIGGLIAASALLLSAAEVSPTARSVSYHDSDIIPINVQVGYSTLIVLPKTEEIVDVFNGDKELFPTNVSANFVYIKSAAPGHSTNMNVQTASGHVYSFIVHDVSTQTVRFDLKIYVNPLDEGDHVAGPKLVRADQLERAQAQIDELNARLARASTYDADKEHQAVTRAIAAEAKNLRHDYAWDHNSKAAHEFGVKAIWHDATHTYLEVDTQTAPALYEIAGDGKDSVVQYTLNGGVYEVPKVLDHGYLRHGKSRMDFQKEQGS